MTVVLNDKFTSQKSGESHIFLDFAFCHEETKVVSCWISTARPWIWDDFGVMKF